MTDEQWTTMPPTERGQYWVYVQRYGEKFVDCVGVGSASAGIFLDFAGSNSTPEFEEPFYLEDITHWIGPLPFPKPPVT